MRNRKLATRYARALLSTLAADEAKVADVVMLIGARLNWLLSHGKGKTWGGGSAKAWGGQKFIQVDISPQEADSRITSYNVCYTKLLRAPNDQGAPIDQQFADFLRAFAAEQRGLVQLEFGPDPRRQVH